MATNKPESLAIHPSRFPWFTKEKNIKNRKKVKKAIKALASVMVDENGKVGVEIEDGLIDEAIDALTDVMLQHGIGACLPRMDSKRTDEEKVPCYHFDPNDVMRCGCYGDECPFERWYAQNRITPPRQPLPEEDRIQ